MINAVDLCIGLCLRILHGCRIIRADLPARLFKSGIKCLEPLLRVRNNLDAIHLIRMKTRDIDVEIFNLGILIEPLRRRRKVRIACTDANDEIRICTDEIRTEASRLANSPEIQRVIPDNRSLARLRLAERDAVLLRKRAECLLRLGIAHAAAKNHDRLFLARDELYRFLNGIRGRSGPLNAMDALFEEGQRIVKGLSFDILRECNADCPCLRRIREDAHRIDARRHQNLGTRHTIPIFADGLKRIVACNRKTRRLLHLLQDGIRLTICIGIARQEENGDAVCRCRCCCRHHVQCAGPDRRCAGIDLLTALLLRESHRCMCHALLIAPHTHDELPRILLKCLSKTDHIAMSKDTKDTFKHAVLLAVEFDVLIVEELHQCLCYREADCLLHLLSSTHILLSSALRLPDFGVFIEQPCVLGQIRTRLLPRITGQMANHPAVPHGIAGCRDLRVHIAARDL